MVSQYPTPEDFYNAKADLKTVDAVSNSIHPDTGQVIEEYMTRKGGMTKTMKGMIKALGFKPATFTFVTGGTLSSSDYDVAIYNPAPNGDNNWYTWGGALPKVIPAGSTPQTTGGFGPAAWLQKTDNVLRPSVIESFRRSYENSGYHPILGSFETGGTLSTISDVLIYEAEGKAYFWGGALPKAVPAGSTPLSSGGIGPSAWADVSQNVSHALNRAQLISWASSQSVINGAVIEGDGLKYRKVDGSTAIPDFLGYEPEGVASPRHWGISPSDTLDQTQSITAMLSWTDLTGRQLDWDDGMYRFSVYLSTAQKPKVKWRTNGKTVLFSTKTAPVGPNYEDDYFIKYTAPTIRTDDITADFFAGGTRLSMASTADIFVGTMVIVQTTRMIETDHRGQARHGFVVPVSRVVSSTQIELQKAIPITCLTTNVNGSVTAVTSATALVVSGLAALERSEARYKITFNTGAAAGLSAFVGDFDVDTQTISCDPNNGSFPPGIVAGDAFTLVRAATISVTNAVGFDVQGNIEFGRPFHTGATAGDLGFRGLFLEKGDRPILKGAIARNFSETGIRIGGWCYAPDVSDIECYNANRAYNGSDGTGYGVSVFQSSWGTFENISGSGCRRILDFGGTQGASYHNETENISGSGGGETYVAGQRFWPVSGGTENSVVGSHGAAVGTVYNDSRGYDVHGILNCRGDAEKARGIYGTGAIAQMLNQFNGDGIDADGIYYRDAGFDWSVPKNKRLQPSDSSKKLRDVIRIAAYNIIPSRAHNIRNVDIQGLTRSLVSIEGPGSVGPIAFQNANLFIDNESGGNPNFDVVRNTGGSSITLAGNVLLDDVRIQNNPSAPKSTINWLQLANFTLASGVLIRLPTGQLMAQIPDDGVITVPTTRTLGTAIMSLRAHATGRQWHLINALLWAGTANDKSRLASTTATGVSGYGSSTKLENSYNVDILSTVLTGTTGADGKMSVAYNPNSESKLYIENRTGESIYAVITCDAVAI